MQEISEARVNIAVNEIFTLLSTPDLGDKTFEGSSMHNLVDAIQMYLTETNRFREKDPKSMALISDMQDRFDKHDRYFDRVEMEKQFELTETFVCREQVTGTIRREKARRMEAAEELRLAAEIAQLKQFRETSQLRQSSEEIQRKISDAERAYFKRKMVVSKSSQMASSECRFQFVRIRGFFDEVHDVKKEGLLREHQRSRIRLEIIHRLNQSDARVKMLEVQISDRVYKKKLQDLNELHIAQNMEEAMLDLLDKVQTGKENAAKEVFELHVKNLKERQEADTRRSQELAKLQADATVEIAKLIASYLKDDNENDEAFQQKEEEVEAIERRKGQGNDGKQTVSVGELYDTVLWSVVKNHCGLTSSDSDCSSDRTFDEDDDDEVGDPVELSQEEPEETVGYWFAKPRNYSFSDGTSCSDASVDESSWIGGFKKGIDLSSAGNMHVKQFSKSYRKREKKLIEQQKVDKRRELTRERNAIRALKMHHQTIVEGLIESCLVERQNLREKIEQRMAALKQHQEETTKELRDTVIGEAATMQEALRADDKRVEDAETESFSKAQTMISAQVFHEVRNALSSVIAMSEIASSMKKDAEVSADQLMSSVEDMLQQIKEVVDYALKMLNNGK